MTESLTPSEADFDREAYTLEEILRPERCALLVIGMQFDFLSHDGFFATSLRQSVSQMNSTISHIQGLIDAAHRAYIPVIFTQGAEDVQLRHGAPDRRRAVVLDEHDSDPQSINSKKGSKGWEFYGVYPVEDMGDVVVQKSKWSAFNGQDSDGKPLEEILRERGVETLVITGVVAETCVETTIRDGYSRDYFIVVPQNSVGSNSAVQLGARMDYWKSGLLGDVVDEEKIQSIWTPPEK